MKSYSATNQKCHKVEIKERNTSNVRCSHHFIASSRNVVLRYLLCRVSTFDMDTHPKCDITSINSSLYHYMEWITDVPTEVAKPILNHSCRILGDCRMVWYT
jgi:hypothetical protein